MSERNLFDVMAQMGLSREEATQLMLKSLVDSLTAKEQKPEKKKIERVRLTNIERFIIALYSATNDTDWGYSKPKEADLWRALKRKPSVPSTEISSARYGKFIEVFLDAIRYADNSEDLEAYLLTVWEDEK